MVCPFVHFPLIIVFDLQFLITSLVFSYFSCLCLWVVHSWLPFPFFAGQEGRMQNLKLPPLKPLRPFDCIDPTFKLFGFSSFRYWAYLMKIIPKTRRFGTLKNIINVSMLLFVEKYLCLSYYVKLQTSVVPLWLLKKLLTSRVYYDFYLRLIAN